MKLINSHIKHKINKVSPGFLRVAELSGWVVALGNSRTGRIGVSWFADNAALRS